jgi:FkbM family methyltransferase
MCIRGSTAKSHSRKIYYKANEVVLRQCKNIFVRKKDSFQKVDDLFFVHHDDLKIYSNTTNVLKSTFRSIFIDKIYDFEETMASPFIIDAGANIGLATLFWKKKFNKAEIICFEPSKVVYELLLKNLNANGFNDVTCINKALSNRATILPFTTDEALSGSLIEEKNLSLNYLVETDLLSKYINKEVDMLKLDIEGAEIDVLLEVKDKLRLVKRIFIEYHSFSHLPQQLSLILSLLERLNFRYYIEGEYKVPTPLKGYKVELGQDLKLNIWAYNTQKFL